MTPAHPPEASPARGGARRAALRGLYGLAWRLARPLLRRNKRLADGFEWRLAPGGWSGTAAGFAPAGVDIWIQAASGGEAYLAWELLKRLAEGTPLSALVTTWTRQGLEVLHGMAELLRRDHPELSVKVTLFPLDEPRVMARALDQAKPRAVALLETELWPGLMLAAAERGVPLLVLNGRMTEKSLRRYEQLERLCPGFWRGVAPIRAAAVSEADAARFAALFGRDRVTVAPNIKFDRCLPATALSTSPSKGREGAAGGNEAANGPAALLPRREGKRAPLILLASVREEEEELLLPVIRQLRRPSASGAAPAVVIAPRHMHRAGAWRERLAASPDGLGEPLLRSRLPDADGNGAPPGSLVIWDAFGELASLYAAADAVFVGGSMARLGGQNFLEPLALGKIPCCGPYLDNFAWALDGRDGADDGGTPSADTLAGRGLLVICRSPDELAATLLQQAACPAAAQDVTRRFTDWLSPRLGGSAACAALVRDAIRPAGKENPGPDRRGGTRDAEE